MASKFHYWLLTDWQMPLLASNWRANVNIGFRLNGKCQDWQKTQIGLANVSYLVLSRNWQMSYWQRTEKQSDWQMSWLANAWLAKKVIGTFQIGKDLIGQWLSAAVESANGIQSVQKGPESRRRQRSAKAKNYGFICF